MSNKTCIISLVALITISMSIAIFAKPTNREINALAIGYAVGIIISK